MSIFRQSSPPIEKVLAGRPKVNPLPVSKNRFGKTFWRYRYLYLMLLPGLIYFAVFRYGPLYFAQIAFKDFKPLVGVEGSPFAGFKYFQEFFNSYYFGQILANTLVISLAKLIFGIPPAIILALAIYETTYKKLGTVVQTITYLPHFLSWVVMFGVLLAMLSPGDGLVNNTLGAVGGERVAFLTTPSVFQAVLVSSDIWKEMGWSAILYLAALIAIDPTLYEAAAIDGASRLRRIWHISLPGITSIIVLLTLLHLGAIMDAGFYQIFITYSLPVYSVADVIDTWVYRQGIINFQLSLATAVGLFKGVIGLILVVVANRIARRITGEGLY
jgi:putative aldouronate transport system permease protein